MKRVRFQSWNTREWAALGIAACVLWVGVACGWGTICGNFFLTDDAYHRDEIVSTDRYMREVWSVSGTQELLREAPRYSTEPVFQLLPAQRGVDGVDYVHVRMVADKRTFNLYIPVTRVKLQTAARGATIDIVWRGEMRVILRRGDYSFGRFVTFRQPAPWTVDADHTRHVSPDQYFDYDHELVGTATISLPNDPSWQQLMVVG